MIFPTYIQGRDTKTLYALLKKHMKGKVLDVGCGDCALKKELAAGVEYVGMDSHSREGVDVVGDVHAIPFGNESFDSVMCTSVLEHVKDMDRVMNEMWRVLKPGGKILITIPFIHHYHKDPEDYQRLSHVGLSTLLEKTGFVDVSTHINYGVYSVVEYTFFCVLVHARREGLFVKKWYLFPYYVVVAGFFFFFKLINYLIGSLQEHDTSMYVGVAAVATKPG